MDTRNIYSIYPKLADAEARAFLNGGETPMPLAPSVELPNGRHWIPQQYLLYEQTETTVSAILNDIGPIGDTLLFSGKDESGLYLQVGTLGPDNYKRKKSSGQRRLVYGRKWRIETYTPTSEVVQTAFLAIKKAFEHDVRELLTITDEKTGSTGTPFSTHIDLPLIASFPDLVIRHEQSGDLVEIEKCLLGIRFDRRKILVDDVAVRKNGTLIVDLKLDTPPGSSTRAGFDVLTLTLVLRECNASAVLHELMNALVRHSDRLVDEQFIYRGFARFSHNHSPHRIANLSVLTRSLKNQSEQFAHVRKELNYETDSRRVPKLGTDRLGQKNRETLAQERNLGGHLPVDAVTEQRWQEEEIAEV